MGEETKVSAAQKEKPSYWQRNQMPVGSGHCYQRDCYYEHIHCCSGLSCGQPFSRQILITQRVRVLFVSKRNAHKQTSAAEISCIPIILPVCVCGGGETTQTKKDEV